MIYIANTLLTANGIVRLPTDAPAANEVLSVASVSGGVITLEYTAAGAGQQGQAGTNGATWLVGTGAPAANLGSVNDLYLDTASGDYYRKTGASTWTLTGNLKGPTGNAGTAGAAGTAGPGYAATSATSLTLGTGSKTFTTNKSGLAYLPGLRVRAAVNGSTYMEGTVVSYSGTELVVNMDRFVGTGTYGTWNIGIAGDVGATGAPGSSGGA